MYVFFLGTLGFTQTGPLDYTGALQQSPFQHWRAARAPLPRKLKGAAYLPKSRMHAVKNAPLPALRVTTLLHLHESQTVCTIKVMIFNRKKALKISSRQFKILKCLTDWARRRDLKWDQLTSIETRTISWDLLKYCLEMTASSKTNTLKHTVVVLPWSNQAEFQFKLCPFWSSWQFCSVIGFSWLITSTHRLGAHTQHS